MLWHSLFMDDRSWDRIEEDLSAERRARAHRRSGTRSEADPGRRYTMEECAAAAKVLDVLGISESVDWVGKAWGGHVGVIFAATSPARCRTFGDSGPPVQAYRTWERVENLLLLLLYRLLGPVSFIQNAVVDTLLSPRTRAEDPAAVRMVRDCLMHANRAKLSNAMVSISLRRRIFPGSSAG